MPPWKPCTCASAVKAASSISVPPPALKAAMAVWAPLRTPVSGSGISVIAKTWVALLVNRPTPTAFSPGVSWPTRRLAAVLALEIGVPDIDPEVSIISSAT